MRLTVMAALIAYLAIPNPAPAAQVDSAIELWPAKTDARVIAIGSLSPARPNETVTVKLLRDQGDGFVRVGRTTAELSRARDVDGDGSYESRFRAAFTRPPAGQCKLVTVFSGDARTNGATESEDFPCDIPDFPPGSGTITSDTGVVNVRLLLAEDGGQQGYGLMYRRYLAPDKGMAFLWDTDISGSFYMLNTLLPLSIAFFDQENRIVRIMDMEPCDDEPCPRYNPEVSYRGALEVNQGAFTEWGVTEGDIITITR
jgi:uncharacterized membrane protein (UPF0127 family)